MTAIIPAQSPEAREYVRYLVAIDERKRRAAELDVELASLKLSVGRFEAEYHARAGVLFVELDRIQLAISEYDHRISRLKASPTVRPEDIENDVGEKYARQREELRAEEDETRRYERVHRHEQARPRLSDDAEDRIKRLYRDLAKRFHPDLARNEEERRQRAEIMQRVNAAFQERDVSGLETIFAEAEVTDQAFEARTIGEKLVWAIREVARLDCVIEALQSALEEARRTESYELWLQHDRGEDIVARLEADLRKEIGHLRNQLASVIGVYRRLVEQSL